LNESHEKRKLQEDEFWNRIEFFSLRIYGVLI